MKNPAVRQPVLNFGLPVATPSSAGSASDKSIDAAFAAFHQENPLVYRKLVQFARAVKRIGWAHYGIASLFERLRWHFHMERKDGEFKLNNNFRSRYARLIMEREPDLQDFFELRRLHDGSEDEPNA